MLGPTSAQLALSGRRTGNRDRLASSARPVPQNSKGWGVLASQAGTRLKTRAYGGPFPAPAAFPHSPHAPGTAPGAADQTSVPEHAGREQKADTCHLSSHKCPGSAEASHSAGKP